ncbi:hypothetical protein [Neorhizobium sp. P12A]|uniref:hypothetical protein n=1 Tax=Neorhizobium sp. P12A TaxID=2268027 RepID=UPI0011EEDB55|nr:hypothetical protein [Neorhizobium sp. P12A]
MVTIGLEFEDLTKFNSDADLKNFIVDYLADAIVDHLNEVKAAATKAGDVAISDRGVTISVGFEL